jgi:quercetin dioxygenase-like cupin family protein
LKLTAIARDEVVPSSVHPLGHACTRLRGARLLTPAAHPVRLVELELDEGARLEWATDHGDEALYVMDGEAEVDRRRCPAGGAIVIESGVARTLLAVGRVRVAHFGGRGPARRDGRVVHEFGRAGSGSRVASRR